MNPTDVSAVTTGATAIMAILPQTDWTYNIVAVALAIFNFVIFAINKTKR